MNAVKQIENPLIESERAASLLRGGSLTNPSDPARTKLAEAASCGGQLVRGRIVDYGCADLRMLKSLARRGWLTLDHPIRPQAGHVTRAGLVALERS